jgi:hypothetical protein
MLMHGFVASLLLVASFVLLATLTSIKTMAERPTFASDIRPILESRCQPCHFQGGQMYDKLPFDKPETITKLGVHAHQERGPTTRDQAVSLGTVCER